MYCEKKIPIFLPYFLYCPKEKAFFVSFQNMPSSLIILLSLLTSLLGNDLIQFINEM